MVTVNGVPLAKYLGQEERINPELNDKKGNEIQQFLAFELKAMRRPGMRLVSASKQNGQTEAR